MDDSCIGIYIKTITHITRITNIYRPRFRLCVAGRIIAAD